MPECLIFDVGSIFVVNLYAYLMFVVSVEFSFLFDICCKPTTLLVCLIFNCCKPRVLPACFICVVSLEFFPASLIFVENLQFFGHVDICCKIIFDICCKPKILPACLIFNCCKPRTLHACLIFVVSLELCLRV